MSKKTKTTTTIKCDRCRLEGVLYAEGPFRNSGAEISCKAWGRAPNGDVGGGTRQYDLCEACLSAFDVFLNGSDLP